ncbi:MAG: YidC/Oxa1 family membrane protein insertase [Treponemataceae bacterium]|nr:YidC/Oxa1 family membrane protein insertase [Treponemataceae bacterium]
MGSVLFAVIIAPLVNILEFFYVLFDKITGSRGIAVVGLSFVVTICTLPLYMVAEKWQEEERRKQDLLRPGVKRIKAAFKGDEQYMILTTFYRQNHYHPLMALRSSFSLLIQIPFFIAAYTFLSHLEPLRGYRFLFINDFGSPDGVLKIGSLAVNVLPILMTVINCVSGAIYSKGHGVGEKVQIFGCAAVFLILLYNSPAGLVVYWTMNNVLSLVKNIFYKLKNPKRVIFALVCAFSAFCVIAAFTMLSGRKTAFRALVVAMAIVLPTLPFFAKKVSAFFGKSFAVLDGNKRLRFAAFMLSAVTLALLAGLVIPSMLMESEPDNYCYVENYTSPFVFLRYTFYQAIGCFVLWPLCFYALFSAKIKKAFAVGFPIVAMCALLNTFAFSGNYGPILPECIFMEPQFFMPTPLSFVLNVVLLAALFVAVLLLLKWRPSVVASVCAIASFALLTVGVRNSASIAGAFAKMTPPQIQTEIVPAYHLSKDGRNVIVLMMDRFFMPFVERCFDEDPSLKEKFDGFVFYKNTVSLAPRTMTGSVGIFGGYSFTPWEINARTDQTLQEKHNQALLTMPVLFHEAGFDVTVSGLPYENYLEYPIEQMYDGYEYVNRAETRGAYSDLWYREHNMEKPLYLAQNIKRNFIWFSLFKMVSPIFRRAVYHDGYWTSFFSYDDGMPRFLDNYSELDYLPALTDADARRDSFIMIDNELVHEPYLMNAPDYVPSGKPVTVFGKGEFARDAHFITMMAASKMLARFFDRLKELDVYGNTRIVIVSDHGTGIKVPELENDIPGLGKQSVVASLLVKDFGEWGGVKTGLEFMTNADTPAIALEGIVPNAKNPFTGVPLAPADKSEYVKIMTSQAQSTRIRKQARFDIAKDEWFTVKDDIFVNENWKPYTDIK